MIAKLRKQIESIIEDDFEEQISDGCKPFNGIKITNFIANNAEQINNIISSLLKIYEDTENNELTYDQINNEIKKYIETTDWDELNRVLFERECKVMNDFDDAFHKRINKTNH